MARLNTSEADLEIERANAIILRKRIPQENPSVFKNTTIPKPSTKTIETQTDHLTAVVPLSTKLEKLPEVTPRKHQALQKSSSLSTFTNAKTGLNSTIIQSQSQSTMNLATKHSVVKTEKSNSSSNSVLNSSMSVSNKTVNSVTKVQQKVPSSLPRPPANQNQLKTGNPSSSDHNVAANEDGTVFKINLSKRLPGRAQLSQTTSSSTINSSKKTSSHRKLSGAKIVLSK